MANQMKVSFITTVLNEEKTIGKLLDSLKRQTKKPDEIIIVDAGSTDKTVFKIKKRREKIKLLIKKGCNRSQGRNLAIRNSRFKIIAISDAGCILDKNWLKEITEPFKDPCVDVVAGYYQGKPKTIFEKCVVPYALVMPDKVNPRNFLPASRSMALRKNIWQQLNGFPEKFSDNEDYVFSRKLKKRKVKIVFQQKAIVYWQPRSNLKSFWIMIYRFARGDAQAGLRLLKMALIFTRYLIGTLIFYYSWVYGFLTTGLYCLWAIVKNYRYVKHPAAFFYLPLLQISSDLAIMSGALSGLLKKI